jgi:hypothetical protein
MAQVPKSGCFCGAVEVELTGQPNVRAYWRIGRTMTVFALSPYHPSARSISQSAVLP